MVPAHKHTLIASKRASVLQCKMYNCIARHAVRHAVHAFSRARDLRTRGGRRSHNAEPSRERRRPRCGPSWPAGSPREDASSVQTHSCRTVPATRPNLARRRRGATGSHPAPKFVLAAPGHEARSNALVSNGVCDKVSPCAAPSWCVRVSPCAHWSNTRTRGDLLGCVC